MVGSRRSTVVGKHVEQRIRVKLITHTVEGTSVGVLDVVAGIPHQIEQIAVVGTE